MDLTSREKALYLDQKEVVTPVAEAQQLCTERDQRRPGYLGTTMVVDVLVGNGGNGSI